MKNIDDLVAELDRFNNSMALVVTKVDNDYIKVNGSLVLKSDSVVIEEIADYFLELTEDFGKDLERSDISDKKRQFVKNAIKIIEIFLTRENGEFSRIKLFRKPDEKGPLSDISLLSEEKVIVQKMISENLRFTTTKKDDFGFTVSDNSKLGLGSLAIMIDEHITAIIDVIVVKISNYFEHLIEPVLLKVSDNNLKALSLSEARNFTTKFKIGNKILTEAVHYFMQLKTTTGIGETMRKYLLEFSLEVPSSMEKKIEAIFRLF